MSNNTLNLIPRTESILKYLSDFADKKEKNVKNNTRKKIITPFNSPANKPNINLVKIDELHLNDNNDKNFPK